MSKTYPELSKSGLDSNCYACNVIFDLDTKNSMPAIKKLSEIPGEPLLSVTCL